MNTILSKTRWFCHITLVIAIVIVANDVKSQSMEQISTTIYISSIDTTRDYFVILSSDSTRNYKIISRKVPTLIQNIHYNEPYNVTLINLLYKFYPKELLSFSNPCHECFNFGEGNLITNDVESRCEIYYCKEFFGLYYTTDILEQDEYQQWIKDNPVEVKALSKIFRKDVFQRRTNKARRHNNNHR